MKQTNKLIFKISNCQQILNSLHAGYFFMLFLLSADFFKMNFFNKFFQENYYSVKQFDRLSVVPDLGSNCLQRLSADDKSRRWQVKS